MLYLNLAGAVALVIVFGIAVVTFVTARHSDRGDPS